MMKLTAEEKEARQAGRRAARQRLADAAAESVRLLLADQSPGTRLPEWARLMARRAAKGNVRAMVGLKCGDCTCWQRQEIKLCTIPSCPLYALRPYKGNVRVLPGHLNAAEPDGNSPKS